MAISNKRENGPREAHIITSLFCCAKSCMSHELLTASYAPGRVTWGGWVPVAFLPAVWVLDLGKALHVGVPNSEK